MGEEGTRQDRRRSTEHEGPSTHGIEEAESM